MKKQTRPECRQKNQAPVVPEKTPPRPAVDSVGADRAAGNLRHRAEERLKEKQRSQRSAEGAPGKADDKQLLIQELQIHQIELETQNEELRQSRAEVETLLGQYTDLYEFAPVGYVTLDRNGAIRRVNLTGAALLGEERSRLMNRRFGLFVSEADRPAFNDFLQRVFTNQAALSDKAACEVTLCNNDDRSPASETKGQGGVDEATRRHVHIEAQTTEDRQECRVAVADITERRRADITRCKQEEKIKASLLEKETMLKEIHHRVKNNLQVISSLLNMQSSYLQDEKAKGMLQNSMDRVRIMAQIHTMLYQSTDLARVDFGGFIKDLAGRLQQSYGTAGSPIEVHVDVADVSLTIDTSIPCGLILNELVANALKHAFPEGRGGEVNISMEAAGDEFVLKVKDNGIGFPATVDFRKTQSLGLELVNLLVGQMNGAIDLQVEEGTAFTIQFPAVSKRG